MSGGDILLAVVIAYAARRIWMAVDDLARATHRVAYHVKKLREQRGE